ncbi:MAG TPA: TetR/AcrR family transcriptional regulator [Candidatus Binatia bacterium]|jgi:AcrR family transcriptional regulator|nr:TetR/AcrR family transcriptional regulator [Candidatus Binatia bacterium]
MATGPQQKATRAAHPDAAWEERALDQMVRGARERFLQRSRKFVEAGAVIVGETGIDGLTLRTLLQRTGLSRRAFYARFQSKDDLLLAVFEQTIRMAADKYRAALEPIPDALDRLRFVVTTMIFNACAEQDVAQSTAMSREHLRLAEARPVELGRALQPLTDLIAEQLAAGVAAGRCRPLELRETAALIHNLVSSTLHHALLVNAERRTEAMADTVWEFCRRAVVADERTPST